MKGFTKESQQLIQAQILEDGGLRVALGAGHLQQFAHQRVEAVGFLLDAIQRGLAVFARAGQLDGDGQPGQRGAQFVGNVEQQAALGVEQGLDAVGHLIEGARELAHLVAALGFQAGREIAPTEALDCFLEAAQRRSQAQGQHVR